MELDQGQGQEYWFRVEKAKYRRPLGLARKLLDLAQKLDCFNEVNGMFQNFIDDKQQELLQKHQEIMDNDSVNGKENEIKCSNPITSRHRGRPLNRYLSESETKQKKVKIDHVKSKGDLLENKEMDMNNKKQRRCKGCRI